MGFLRALLSSAVVMVVLNWILQKNVRKSRSKNVDRFTARCGRSVIPFACVGIGLCMVIELGAYLEHEYMPPILTVLLIIVLGLPSLFLALSVVPGFWEMSVDQDDVTITKLFVFKRHWKISEIERCVLVTGEARVYVRGRKRMAFLVDGMFDNFATFIARMEKEQIPIINKVKERDED